MKLPLSQIAVVKRGRRDLGKIDDLVQSFKDNGQITPITVRPPRDDDPAGTTEPWVLVAGGRRLAAAINAGWEFIEAFDIRDLPPLQQKIIELEENIQRKDMSFDEVAQMNADIHALKKEEAESKGEEWTARDTARHLGTSATTISRSIKVANAIKADPSLKQAGTLNAATRIIDMREHLAAREVRGERGVGTLRTRLVCADAREWLRSLPTGSVDLVLTDPPYAIDALDSTSKTADGQNTSTIAGFNDSESYTKDVLTDCIPQLLRVTNDHGWIAMTTSDALYPWLKKQFEDCCARHFEYVNDKGYCPGYYAEGPLKGIGCRNLKVEEPRWIWYRPNSPNPSRFPELHAQNQFENILVLNRGGARLLKKPCGNVIVVDTELGNRIHTTQKPQALARELVERFTLLGELVIDPFFGSGNLLAGATSMHRRIAGCEFNKDIIEQALGNVAEHYSGEKWDITDGKQPEMQLVSLETEE